MARKVSCAIAIIALAFGAHVWSSETLAADLATRMADYRQITLDPGIGVKDTTFTIGHLELKMYSGNVYIVKAGDGSDLGFYFEGNGRYTYQSEDPADLAVLEENLDRTGNQDLLQRGVVTDTVDRAFGFFARTPQDAFWTSGSDPVIDPGADGRFAKLWKKVERTYLEYEHLLEQARSNDHGQYVYVELDGANEDVGYVYDLMRGFGERLFSFRKFSGYDLRFFESLSSQLIDGGPTRQPVALTLIHLDLDVSTDDNEQVRIVSEQTFRADRELSTITLLLDNNADPFAYDWESDRYALNVTAVKDADGQELSYSHRYHEILVDLPKTVGPGEEFTLRFELEGDYIRYEQKEAKRDLFALHTGSWYPQPFGWSSRKFTMKVRFKTRKPFRPVSSGALVALSEEGNHWVLEAESERPVDLIALFAGEYTTLEKEFDGLTVRVHAYTPRGEIKDKKKLDNLARLTYGMIDYFSKTLVPYPFDTIEVLDLPDFYGGIAPSGMALMGAPTFGNRGVNHILAHELAHQWFGHMASPASSRDRWLSESFAEYTSGLALAALAGRDRNMFDFKQMHEQWWTDALDCRDAGPIAAADMLSGPEAGFARYRLLYSKGPLVLRMLHSQVGNDRFYEILRTFLNEADYGPATTLDFRKIVEKALGQEMDWYFRQWIEEGGLPEIRVTHKVQERGGKPMLVGSAKLVDGQPFKRMSIPLVLEFKSGNPEVRWVAFEKPEVDFEFELAAAPSKVKVDPARNFLAVFK